MNKKLLTLFFGILLLVSTLSTSTALFIRGSSGNVGIGADSVGGYAMVNEKVYKVWGIEYFSNLRVVNMLPGDLTVAGRFNFFLQNRGGFS